MNFLGRLKRRFTKAIREWAFSSVSFGGADISSMLAGMGAKRRDSLQWLGAFQTISQVRAPVNRISEDVARVKVHLRRRLPGPVGIDGRPPSEEVHDHPLMTLLKCPNPKLLGSKFFWLIQVWLEMTGRAPIRIVWGKGGIKKRVPIALVPIPPHTVIDMPTSEKPWYKIQGGKGKPLTVPKGDIIWINIPDVINPYGPGCGPATAVDDEVSQIDYAGRWNNNFYRQGANPGKIVAVEGLSPAVRDVMQKEWASKYQGVDNAHRTLFIDGKVSVGTAGPTHKELDFRQTVDGLSDRVRFNWSVPPELLGDVKNSNRATAHAASYLHQSNNVAGRCLFLEEVLNFHLVPLFRDPELFLEWENPVKEAAEFIHTMLTDGWKAGTVKRDEWRMGHHMDPIGGPLGDTLSIPLNMDAVQASSSPRTMSWDELPKERQKELAHAYARAASLYS